jgi:heptosyltransferase-2
VSEVYYYRAMLAGVGLSVSAAPDVSLRVPPEWREAARALLPGDGPWLGVNPGAAFGTAKRWIPERFSAVAARLSARYGLRVVLLGGPAEGEVAERVAAALRGPSLRLTGKTRLLELTGVLAELRLLLTNDSGPMHLAAAVGTPVAAVVGPTDWRETHPFTEKAALVREEVPCAPCKLRDCPIDHRCMDAVTVERVTREAERLLEAAQAPPVAA